LARSLLSAWSLWAYIYPHFGAMTRIGAVH
jgi:hypothetical protein